MGRLGTILGSSVATPEGEAIVAAAAERGDMVLPRHGPPGEYRLPHLIDHEANLRRLAEGGCDRVLSICSAGSLDPEIAVGSFVCPHDFIALGTLVTSFADARGHLAPGFDPAWRGRVLAAWEAGGAAPSLRDGGVYWQTSGPRFETPAEIRLIAAHADLVGMTMAAECVLAAELGLAYAAVCVVDNLANGVGGEPLAPARLERDRAANAAVLRAALEAVLPELSG